MDTELGYELISQSGRSVGLESVQILAVLLRNSVILRNLFKLSDPHFLSL